MKLDASSVYPATGTARRRDVIAAAAAAVAVPFAARLSQPALAAAGAESMPAGLAGWKPDPLVASVAAVVEETDSFYGCEESWRVWHGAIAEVEAGDDTLELRQKLTDAGAALAFALFDRGVEIGAAAEAFRASVDKSAPRR